MKHSCSEYAALLGSIYRKKCGRTPKPRPLVTGGIDLPLLASFVSRSAAAVVAQLAPLVGPEDPEASFASSCRVFAHAPLIALAAIARANIAAVIASSLRSRSSLSRLIL